MSEETQETQETQEWAPAVSSGIEFIKASTLAEEGTLGEILVGEFLEALPNRFDADKSDFKFKRQGDGMTVVINSTGSLDFQMRSVKPGTLCQIVYNGKEVLEKGAMKGKEAHNFKVNVAV